jgi:hypothetical protein
MDTLVWIVRNQFALEILRQICQFVQAKGCAVLLIFVHVTQPTPELLVNFQNVLGLQETYQVFALAKDLAYLLMLAIAI